MKVIDASALINVLAFPEEYEVGRPTLEDHLIAPAILIPEFLNGVRKLLFRNKISPARADLMVSKFGELRIELRTLSRNQSVIWAMSKNMNPYDATYVLIARQTMSPLITSDARLARTASRNTDVILLE